MNLKPSDLSGKGLSHYYCQRAGEAFVAIPHSDALAEFFTMVVSATNHWIFVSSRGAITAGRKNSKSSLFPYYCADKIIDLSESVGPKSIIQLDENNGKLNWEPFSKFESPNLERTQNFYKSVVGDECVFEESILQRQLTFSYSWTFSERFGIVRRCELRNDSQSDLEATLLDGLENIIPAGMDPSIQLRFSNLGDAYKKNELLSDSEIGVYYLSSIPSDHAEPSEGLRANVVWSQGLEGANVLLSSSQIDRFRRTGSVETEVDVRGTRGAYLRCLPISIPAGKSLRWSIVAELDLDQCGLIALDDWLRNTADVATETQSDISHSRNELRNLVASTDGLQQGNDRRRTHRHQSNVLFNIMRGGIPIDQYAVPVSEFTTHIENSNRDCFSRQPEFLRSLPDKITTSELTELASRQNDADLLRLASEFMPLTFSRRHGDPTRPWNEFSIDVVGSNGKRSLSYQGNWRDIFQNWEALSISFPDLAPNMVFRFLNASTADGYNPYRITNDGIEWERLDPNDPWSNIGYWGDHQIVYLHRLLTKARQFAPHHLDRWLTTKCFAYANVPYRIKPFEQILATPQQTISFDDDADSEIQKLEALVGADGKLLQNANRTIHHVSLVEKLLVPAFAKMSNLVPEGGIWLNTQRPEWNDANNALVGSGLSVVTTCDLRSYFVFLLEWLGSVSAKQDGSVVFELSAEFADSFQQQKTFLSSNLDSLEKGIDDIQRRSLVDGLSRIGSEFRLRLYEDGFSGQFSAVPMLSLQEYCQSCIAFLDHTIKSNVRDDKLFHSYNLIEFGANVAKINRLYEMLEGQVAVLNSGLLSASQSLDVLDALRASSMFRADQNSYMLYPERGLPSFLEKNLIDENRLRQSTLLTRVIESNEHSIVMRDIKGEAHFNGDLRNSSVLRSRIGAILKCHDEFDFNESEIEVACKVYEETFNHASFTGRSGTFFAFEGLGSIYWHMVSKLRLSVAEQLAKLKAIDSPTEDQVQSTCRFRKHFDEISYGLGITKTPTEFGAIPSDPYSHTPKHAGAQQPGMTGQVKEDILTRFLEIGLRIDNGMIGFDPQIFDRYELTTAPTTFEYLDVNGNWNHVEMSPNQFAFTICQVPIVYRADNSNEVSVSVISSGGQTRRDKTRSNWISLTTDETRHIFARDNSIKQIEVTFPLELSYES